MEPELLFIKNKKLTEKQTFEFYINIGYNPTETLLKMGLIFNTSYEQLCSCIKILNEGWYPNWENEAEYKYWNLFKMNGGFSFWRTTYNNTDAYVPSALCLKDVETANLAKHILLELYEKVYL